MYCADIYQNNEKEVIIKIFKNTHATEADLAAAEKSQIQRRTEAAGGCRETSGSESQTGWRALEWRRHKHINISSQMSHTKANFSWWSKSIVKFLV